MCDFSTMPECERIAEDINYCNFAVRIPKMTISQFEAEGSSAAEQQSVILEEVTKRTSPTNSVQSKRNPPARNTSRFWFERFLAVIQRQNPSVIDASFLSQIAPSNEGKLLAQLKFLGVIDEQGKPTRVLPLLNMVGDEQKKAFQEISKEAYRDLQAEVKMEKAVPDDLVNFFIRKYGFTRDKGINAAKFYLYLVEKSDLPISSELATFLSEKSVGISQVGNSSTGSPTRGAEKPISRIPTREIRASSILSNRPNQQRKLRSRGIDTDDEKSPIQAIINIKLEKDTPKEYWDRVLALLGEKQAVDNFEANPNQASNSQSSESLDQELSTDSAFT
jgi:Family of unknown function (DUF5343)